jgi:hypothetical protein
LEGEERGLTNRSQPDMHMVSLCNEHASPRLEHSSTSVNIHFISKKGGEREEEGKERR